MTPILNIIGAGRVGQTLAYLWVKNQLVQIGGVYNQTKHSTLKAIEFIGQGAYCNSLMALPPADIILISTPDEFISEIAKTVSSNLNIKNQAIVFHCSGTLDSDTLLPFKEKGCFIASVHPMTSVNRPDIRVTDYAGTYCAMEGDDVALAVIGPLFKAIGSIVYPIKKEKKALYHAAGVFASNYIVTLSQQALDCLLESGVEEKIAMPLTLNLMRSTLTNLEHTLSSKAALTGPIQRGDLTTIKKHLETFTDNQKRELYQLLGQATLELTELSPEVRLQILSQFTSKSR